MFDSDQAALNLFSPQTYNFEVSKSYSALESCRGTILRKFDSSSLFSVLSQLIHFNSFRCKMTKVIFINDS